MSSRIPGILGIVLNQAPQVRKADGGMKPIVPNRGPLNPQELTARVTVSHSAHATHMFDCVRGETVTLDASGSSARAQYFEWSLIADELPVVQTDTLYTPENPPPGRKVVGKKQGKKITVLALASFTATLVVRDATSTSPALSVNVRVQPRAWKTSFTQRPQLQTFSKFYGANALLDKHAGSNMCAICGTDIPYGHSIHHKMGSTDWKGQFHVKQAEDPGGPFDGFWYVDKIDLRVDRGLFINSELTVGQVFKLNNKKDTPAEYREGLKARVECTKLHEKLHGELLKQKLDEPGMDPALRVEILIGDDEESLAEQANTEIALKENILQNATTGPDGHGALRRRLEKELKATRVKFLLPQSKDDEKGVAIETDLLGFSD